MISSTSPTANPGGAPVPLIVGAGFAGAVLARQLADEGGQDVEVIDARPHVAGNCHTERDAGTDVMLHLHGPHIFNTNHEDVWRYVQRFGQWMPFRNPVKAVTARGVFSMPINLHTINQFYGLNLDPAGARAFIEKLADHSIAEPANFEEQALRLVGRDLYENFLKGYTEKQWGVPPAELPASLLKRLPIRFNYDDNYYAARYQAIPRDGYTAVISRLLAHPRIQVRTGVRYEPAMAAAGRAVFFSGPLDAFFGHRHGRLGYRTIQFERITGEGDLQGNPVINYTEAAVPWTRRHEHKHFAPWEKHEKSVVFTEYSKAMGPDDVPYYPMRLSADLELLRRYEEEASATTGVTFIGRLGTYRYLDMDQVIGESLDLAPLVTEALRTGSPIPVFGPRRAK